MKRGMVSAAVISCVVLIGAVPASASTASWRVQLVPRPPSTSTFLQGVSCPARGNCTAVGFATSAGNPSTLAEHWDGSRWAIQPTPNPAGAPQASLAGVSCASPASCTAVGSYYSTSGYQPLAELWDGVSWALQTVPLPAGAPAGELGSVSCASPASCTAVGFYVPTNGGGNLPLAEHWNGTSWAVQAAPAPGGDGELLSVSCPTAVDCIAVGESSGLTNVLAERWTGSRWTAQTIPRPAGTNMELLGVSCKAPEYCIAVGDETTRSGSGTTTGAIVERSIGTTWTIQADAAPAGTALFGVSCAWAKSCTAVGEDGLNAGPPPIPTHSLAEHWDGTSWALQTVPEPTHTFGASLAGVSCLGTLYCTAVGDYGRPGRARAFPLANHYG